MELYQQRMAIKELQNFCFHESKKKWQKAESNFPSSKN